MISDIELEENIREEIEENIKNLFEIYNDQKRKDWFSIYLNSIVLQFDPHTYYFAREIKIDLICLCLVNLKVLEQDLVKEINK